MGNAKKDISIAIVLLSVSIIFILGMVKWTSFPKDGTLIGNLYYVTVSSVLYTAGVVINILAQSKWTKIASFFLMGVFGWNLYVELFLDPTNWSNFDLGLLVFVTANCTLTGWLIEWLKSKNKKQ